MILVLFSFLIGRRILSSFKLSSYSLSETLLLSTTCGFGIITSIMFILGVMGLFYQSVIILTVVIPFITLFSICGRCDYLFVKEKVRLLKPPKYDLMWVLFAIFIFYVLYNLFRCMTPVINGDSLSGYLHVPNLYVNNHCIFDIDYTGDDCFPQNIYMLNALGILLHSDILSQMISGWLLGLLCALAVYVLAKKLANRKAALISAIIFYTMPALSWLIYSTKVDLGYTLFELSFWILFVEWIRKKDKKMLFVSAIFLGFAIGSKYHALLAMTFAALTAFVLLVIRKEKLGIIIITLFLFSIIAIMIGSPSYIKNFIYTGDPVYPFITNPSTGSAEKINQYHGVVDFVRFQYNMFLGKDYFFVTKPMMDYPIGFLSLLFLPFVFKIKKNDKLLYATLAVLLGYYLFLSTIIYKSVFPYPRHLLPAIGVLVAICSIGVMNSLNYCKQRYVILILVVGVIGITVVNNVPILSKQTRSMIRMQYSYLIGNYTKNEYLTNTLFNSGGHMNFGMIQHVWNMPNKTRIITLDYGCGYYINRPFLKKGYVYAVKDIDSLLNSLKKDNVTHIYFSKSDMDKYVARWCNGNYSLIFNMIQRMKIAPEYISADQYLYRLTDIMPQTKMSAH